MGGEQTIGLDYVTGEIGDVLDGARSASTVTDDDVGEAGQRGSGLTDELEVLVGVAAPVVDADLVDGHRAGHGGNQESASAMAPTVTSS